MYKNAEFGNDSLEARGAWKPACAKIIDCVGCGESIGKAGVSKGICNYC